MTQQPISERLAAKRQPGARPTVNRRDIDLTEEVEHEIGLAQIEGRSHYWWTASLTGRVFTGERVDLGRQGATSAEALAALEAAIEENGWEIR